MDTLRPRQTLSQPDLVALLNFELAAYEECAGCHVISVDPVLVIEDTGEADPRKKGIVEQVLAETRAQFDLAPRGAAN
jgi:hypothetical protein